jgi:hypothetical protein
VREGEPRRLSAGARKRAQVQWLLASQLGPAGGEGGRFRSVDEACLVDSVVMWKWVGFGVTAVGESRRRQDGEFRCFELRGSRSIGVSAV